MTADATAYGPPLGSTRPARRLLAATWRASRSPWLWTPAAVGTAGLATATVALGRLLTTPPTTLSPRPSAFGLRVAPAEDGFVHLTGPAAGVAGRWGLEYPGGWGTVGGPEDEATADRAKRPFVLARGSAPASHARCRLVAAVWPDRETFTAETGIVGRDAVVQGETGPLPAWVFPSGTGRRWAILVHGRGAPRAQMLRMVPELHARGITAMVISYRNDSASCSDPSGRMHFGHREWEDLEAAARSAVHQGAADLLLGGMSLGGGIIATFLRRSSLAPLCRAAILDAPALNWGPILRHVARSRRVPGWLVPGVMTAAALSARIDWAALNHLHTPDPLTAPVLLIHGDRDPVVPVALSDAYAEAAPDLVTYLRVEGAGHVSSWNTAPAAYAQALSDFLDGPAA